MLKLYRGHIFAKLEAVRPALRGLVVTVALWGLCGFSGASQEPPAKGPGCSVECRFCENLGLRRFAFLGTYSTQPRGRGFLCAALAALFFLNSVNSSSAVSFMDIISLSTSSLDASKSDLSVAVKPAVWSAAGTDC